MSKPVTMKELIVVVTLAVIASPAASMTLKSNNNAVWIDYEAMKGADRLINAGVNRWDPERLRPFLACFLDPGTEITVTKLHTFYNYADVVVTSRNCAGVVHLDAINTGTPESAASEESRAAAKKRDDEWEARCVAGFDVDPVTMVQRYRYKEVANCP